MGIQWGAEQPFTGSDKEDERVEDREICCTTYITNFSRLGSRQADCKLSVLSLFLEPSRAMS